MNVYDFIWHVWYYTPKILPTVLLFNFLSLSPSFNGPSPPFPIVLTSLLALFILRDPTLCFFLLLSRIPGKSQALRNLTVIDSALELEKRSMGSRGAGKSHNYGDCFSLSSWPQISCPQYCLLTRFPCSFHSTPSKVTFYTFYLLLSLEHFPPSSHSQLMTFLLIALEKIATLQKDFPATPTNSTSWYPNPLPSFLWEWVNRPGAHLSQPLCWSMRSHPLWPNRELRSCSYPWCLWKHLLRPPLFSVVPPIEGGECLIPTSYCGYFNLSTIC